MKQLTPLARPWHSLTRPSNWFTPAIVGVLVCIEIMGRRSSTDLADLVHLLMLVVVGLFVHARHRERPLAWVSGCMAAYRTVLEWSQRLRIEIGFDMRGSPPLPRRLPAAMLLLFGVLGMLFTLNVFGAAEFPAALREFGVSTCYLGYLLLLALLWSLVSVAVLFAIFIPIAILHDLCLYDRTGKPHLDRRREYRVVVAFFVMLFLAAVLLPLWVHLTFCGIACLVNIATLTIPANRQVQLIWRSKSGGPIWAIPWGLWVVCEFLALTLIYVNLALLTAGSEIVGQPRANETMSITSFMGSVLLMMTPGVLGTLLLQTVLGRLRDPARPEPPVLHVQGEITPALLRAAYSRGWRVVAAQRPGWLARWRGQLERPARPTDVRIRLVTPEQSQAREFNPKWPLAVSEADLVEGSVFERLARRDELQKRRLLVRGIEKLMRTLTRREYQQGGGFWLAPHCWFVAGVTRDAHEDEIDLNESPVLTHLIGPPYHFVFAHATRHYCYALMQALEIDLIFVEDGIGHRKLTKVLRRMFELYDRTAGQCRAEDAMFTGIPGVRVIFHDFTLEEPFKSDDYPEPQYEHLGRGRIMHVFKDRGEQDEPLETPMDFSFTPAPLLMS